MSLDAFATTIATSRINNSVKITDDLYKIFDLDENGFFIFNPKPYENEGDFAYWRNFYHLQDWMEQLFYQKGGSDENDFNDFYKIKIFLHYILIIKIMQISSKEKMLFIFFYLQ